MLVSFTWVIEEDMVKNKKTWQILEVKATGYNGRLDTVMSKKREITLRFLV